MSASETSVGVLAITRVTGLSLSSQYSYKEVELALRLTDKQCSPSAIQRQCSFSEVLARKRTPGSFCTSASC